MSGPPNMDARLPAEVEHTLENLIQRETSELAKFIQLLEQELDALAHGKIDEVQECARQKQSLLAGIFAARDAVNVAARNAAADPHLKSAEAWLARSTSPRVRSAFEELTDHADHARQLNQLAGRLVQTKLRGIQQRLEILQPAGLTDAVYYPEGYAAAQRSAAATIGRA